MEFTKTGKLGESLRGIVLGAKEKATDLLTVDFENPDTAYLRMPFLYVRSLFPKERPKQEEQKEVYREQSN